ncbi:hypothetical protein COO91_10349 (plasmid) [Nostoc flagelliforme CCNUN1]|uniref:Uncharacterized protein n=1 Tax=Nostoc flagelliforme CCNUN1 TaxID=2038116 RepID=A0A2K8T8Z7_9NOSO|nr:hypothetical protein COO91_10349 [Nostoc flagelliforme CCNUN1]
MIETYQQLLQQYHRYLTPANSDGVPAHWRRLLQPNNY